jgi:DNA-binding NtrC family response regulator
MQMEGRTTGTVLVVDDDRDMRNVLKDFLERDGHRVIEADNGADALFLVEAHTIDLAILDKEMPGINGLDVLSFLHQRCPALPVIFITAFGGGEVAEESRQRGARYYIEKPFRVGRIMQAVRRVMQRGP